MHVVLVDEEPVNDDVLLDPGAAALRLELHLQYIAEGGEEEPIGPAWCGVNLDRRPSRTLGELHALGFETGFGTGHLLDLRQAEVFLGERLDAFPPSTDRPDMDAPTAHPTRQSSQ
jgi:hypothetical protein